MNIIDGMLMGLVVGSSKGLSRSDSITAGIKGSLLGGATNLAASNILFTSKFVNDAARRQKQGIAGTLPGGVDNLPGVQFGDTQQANTVKRTLLAAVAAKDPITGIKKAKAAIKDPSAAANASASIVLDDLAPIVTVIIDAMKPGNPAKVKLPEDKAEAIAVRIAADICKATIQLVIVAFNVLKESDAGYDAALAVAAADDPVTLLEASQKIAATKPIGSILPDRTATGDSKNIQNQVKKNSENIEALTKALEELKKASSGAASGHSTQPAKNVPAG